jgi:hypothetical protein
MNPEPELSQRSSLGDFLTLADFESAARQSMAQSVYEYLAGGAGDEISLRANQIAFDRIYLLPRVLRDSRLSIRAPRCLARNCRHRFSSPRLPTSVPSTRRES